MGGSSSRNLGSPVGVWFDGKPIYANDMEIVKSGIETGKYIVVDNSAMAPEGTEKWFYLYNSDKTKVTAYARASTGFTQWWVRNRKEFIGKIAAECGMSYEEGCKLATVVLPILLETGVMTAEKIASLECPGHKNAKKFIDLLNRKLTESNFVKPEQKYLEQMKKPVQGSHEVPKVVSHGAYLKSAEKMGANFSGGYHGGCGCGHGDFIGSDELDLSTVRNYEDSINSKAKNQIIDDIIQTGINLGLKITGETRQDKIKSMLSLLPHGNQLKTDDAVQRKLCIGIADAINRAFGSEVINKSLSADVICQQVAEIVLSLSAGMHTEFLAIHNEVRRILKNLHVLKEALSDDHESIVGKIKESGDLVADQQLTMLNDLHKILTDEITRQIEMLSNLLNVSLLPSEKNLADLIKNQKDLHVYIDKIDVRSGTSKFGNVVADILKGLGITANFALLIENALKTVGLTIDDYAKSESVQKLRDRITQGLMGKQLDDEQLHKYLDAADLLYKNFYRNQEIASAAHRKTGQYEGSYMGSDELYGKTVMDKRVTDRRKLRNLIFDAFYKQLINLFGKMVSAINILSMKIGREVPLSDQLDGFKITLKRIDETLVMNKNIYFALIGYYNDALSISKRDRFLADLASISNNIEVLLEMPIYASSRSYFETIRDQIKAIIALIDKFSDEVAAKFGRGEEVDTECAYLEKKEVEGAYDEDDMYDGAYNGAHDGSYSGMFEPEKPLPEIKMTFKPTQTIHDAIVKFGYNYNNAQIDANFESMKKEYQKYAENYDKVSAASVADILSSYKKEYDALRSHLTNDGHFGNESAYKVEDTEFATEAGVRKERVAAINFLDAQWEAKKKFWATIEAVDSYMKIFTNKLISNRRDVLEIKAMLSNVETIRDWYSDRTGNELASVFDFFPNMMKKDATNGVVSMDKDVDKCAVIYPSESYVSDLNDHYYKRISDAYAKDTDPQRRKPRPGNPHLVTVPTRGIESRNRLQKTLSGLGVLKNLLSVFVHVGSKFGGETIKTFMTATQMYNNLVEYMQASAFSQGFGTGEHISDSTELNSSFFNASDITAVVDTTTGSVKSESAGVDDNLINIPVGVTYSQIDSFSTSSMVNSQLVSSIISRINEASDAVIRRLNEGKGLRSAFASKAADTTSIKMDDNSLNIPNADHVKWETISSDNVENVILFKKRWGVWMRSINEGLKKYEGFSFKREDEYFVLIMKSLAAKILTVVGMYDLFDRPMEYNGLNPIRMIVGGSIDTPKVDAEAVPLYLRLPLLAQFYRGIFGLDGATDDSNKFEKYDAWRSSDKNIKISLVPDLTGTFAGLINLVFKKNKFITGTNYSDDEIKELIREVNLIYQRMREKHPQNTVRETINEFVAEVNRRYGVISQEDRNKYLQEFGYRYDYADYNSNRSTVPMDRYNSMPDVDSIPILPGEDEDEIERISPAQRLLGESFTSSSRKSPFTITPDHKKLVYNFRCAIDKYFENPEEEITFNSSIRATQTKLKNEQNDENRFKLVASLVRGVDVYSKTDSMKYVLFHETVISGLNVLSAIHSMLSRFKIRAHLIDVKTLEEQIWDYLIKPGEKDMDRLVKHVNNHFSKNLRIIEDKDSQHQNIIEHIFGRYEADCANGGHVEGGSDYTLKGIDGVTIGSAGNPLKIERFPKVHSTEWNGINKAFVKGTATTKGQMIISQTDDKTTPPNDAMNGLVMVLAGYSVENLKKAYYSKKLDPKLKDEKNAADTFMKFIFSREYIMKELIESLFGLSSDLQGLVNVRIENGNILLNCGDLKTLISDMFQHVSYFINLLRPHISPKIMMQYTDKFNPGSYYWLQEQLMEKIINGRPGRDLIPGEPDSLNTVGYASLDDVARRLSYTYQYLTREWTVDGSGLLDDKHDVKTVNSYRCSYDKVFAEMIFYDGTKPSSGISPSNDANEFVDKYGAKGGLKLVEFLRDPYDSLHVNGPLDGKTLDTRFIARFYQLYSWKNEFTLNRSAMFAFNQLIAKFIQTFYDPVSGKMYSGLINNLANGVFNMSIADYTKTYPDTSPVWYINYSTTGTEIKMSPLFALENELDISDHRVANDLAEIVKHYLTYGTKAGASPAERKFLLSPGSDLVNDMTNDLIDANNVGIIVPCITINLMFYTIIDIVKAILDAAVGEDGTTTAGTGVSIFTIAVEAFLRVVVGRAPGNGSLGAYRKAFNGGADLDKDDSIDYATLVNSFLATYDTCGKRATLLYSLLGKTVTNTASGVGKEKEYPAAGSPLTGILGKFDTGVLNGYEYLGKYKAIFNKLIQYSDVWGGVALSATLIFPDRDNAIGDDSDDKRSFNAKYFSLIVMNLAKHVISTKNKALSSAGLGMVKNIIYNERKLYTGKNSKVTPHHIVKYDDLLNANGNEFDKANISNPTGDPSFLVLARNEPMNEIFLPDRNIEQLKVTVPEPDNTKLENITQFGRRWDPDEHHVLFSSLAAILRNLLTSRTKQTQSLVYLIENVADIPLYMKEKMKANLPLFRNLFRELQNRCEFIKRFMMDQTIDCTRDFTAAGIKTGADFELIRKPTHNPWPFTLLEPVKASGESKTRFAGILDTVVRGCTAMITSCERVLTEIGDDPKYFELYQNSIRDYKTQYNMDPFMPLSSTMVVCKNTNENNNLDFFPIHSLGEDQFKILYGVRSLLNNPTAQPLMDHVPGFVQTIDMYNMIVDTKMQVDKSKAEGYLKTFVKLLRYVTELKHLKGNLTPYVYHDGTISYKFMENQKWVSGLFCRDDLVLTGFKPGGAKRNINTGTDVNERFTIYANDGPVLLTNRSTVSIVADDENDANRKLSTLVRLDYPKSVYSISKSLSDTIKLTESSMREDRIKDLVTYILDSKKHRNSPEIQNIIDLNIVPINVHALMREIPLINLYNYAYTFDRLIIELYYGLQNENARKLITELCDPDMQVGLRRITSAKDMLVALLLNPYMDIFLQGNDDVNNKLNRNDRQAANYYEQFVKSMFDGVPDNGELGRPKFLSDQIYNKVVFGELYSNREEYNEMGPAVNHLPVVTSEAKLELAANIASLMLHAMNSDGRFKDVVMGKGVSPLMLCKIACRYIFDDIRFNVATKKYTSVPSVDDIYNKMNKLTAAEFKYVAAIADADSQNTLALFVSLACIPVCCIINNMFNRLNITKLNQIQMEAYATSLVMIMKIFNIMGAKHADYLGMTDNNLNGGNSITSKVNQLKQLNMGLFDNNAFVAGNISKVVKANTGIQFTNANFDIAGLDVEDVKGKWLNEALTSELDHVVQTMQTSLKFGKGAADAAKAVTSPKASQFLSVLNAINEVRQYKSVDKLHWLDINPVKEINNYGVGIQNDHSGDNYNVLDPNQVKETTAIDGIIPYLRSIGRLRFDTVLIRNLIFVVNLYRSVRIKLRRQLDYDREIITRAEPITKPSITEFYGNQVDAGNYIQSDIGSMKWRRSYY